MGNYIDIASSITPISSLKIENLCGYKFPSLHIVFISFQIKPDTDTVTLNDNNDLIVSGLPKFVSDTAFITYLFPWYNSSQGTNIYWVPTRVKITDAGELRTYWSAQNRGEAFTTSNPRNLTVMYPYKD